MINYIIMTKIDYETLYLDEEVITLHIDEENKTYNEQGWTVQVKGLGSYNPIMPDCMVGNWLDNFWFRTPKGMRGEKYTSKEIMKKAIEKMLKKYGYTVVRWQPYNNK